MTVGGEERRERHSHNKGKGGRRHNELIDELEENVGSYTQILCL